MNQGLKALLEEKGKLAGTIRQMADKINAENRDFTAEEKTGWDKVNADYNDIQRRIEIQHRAAEVSGSDRRPEPAIDRGASVASEGVRAEAMAGWFQAQQFGADAVSPRLAESMRAVGLGAHTRELTIRTSGTHETAAFQRLYNSTHPSRRHLLASDPAAMGLLAPKAASLVTTSTSQAGYLIAPGGFLTSLETAMLAFGGIRQYATVKKTNHGETVYLPSVDDTGNEGELLGEATTVGNSVNPTARRQSLGAWKFSSKIVRYSYEMLEDSAFDLPGMLGDMLGIRLGRITAKKHTIGAGTTEPLGIVTEASAGVTAASATVVTADELINLLHAVPVAYRARAAYLASDDFYLGVRKLKDSTGNYLWRSVTESGSIATGFTDILNGRPAYVSMEMATPATGVVSALCGPLDMHTIRAVNEIRIRRLTERYADTDEEAMIAFVREDSCTSKPLGTSTIKKLTQA